MADTWNIGKLSERLQTEADAYLLMEQMRWGDRPVCPHCDSERVHFLNPENGTTRKTRTGNKSERRVWFCGACRKQFSVLTGTVFHGTKISLRKWLFVVFEMVSSKNGVAAREIERKYGLTNKTAWFMLHRVREAMQQGPLASMMSGTVIADETWIGGRERNRPVSKRTPKGGFAAEPMRIVPGSGAKGSTSRGPLGNKTIVLTLIDRDRGQAHSRIIPDVTGATLRKTIAERVDMPNTTLHTDEAKGYKTIASEFAAHETVNHAQDEYARYENGAVITSNHAESYFSQLKRSLDGTHHHVSREHLGRYLAEFDYRYSTRKLSDTARMNRLMGQVGGRRLTYKRVVG